MSLGEAGSGDRRPGAPPGRCERLASCRHMSMSCRSRMLLLGLPRSGGRPAKSASPAAGSLPFAEFLHETDAVADRDQKHFHARIGRDRVVQGTDRSDVLGARSAYVVTAAVATISSGMQNGLICAAVCRDQGAEASGWHEIENRSPFTGGRKPRAMIKRFSSGTDSGTCHPGCTAS